MAVIVIILLCTIGVFGIVCFIGIVGMAYKMIFK